MTNNIETELQTIREQVARLLERTEPLPLAMRYEKAAKLLDISVSKLRAMIASGTIRTVVVHKRRMVPRSELERVTTPTLPKKLRVRLPESKKATPSEWAAAAKTLKRR